MDLDLRHLRVVCAIADAGSLSKAAVQLGLSQPALTTQLRRIERILGGALFVRTRHGTHPTTLGEFVVAKAGPVLPLLDHIKQEAITHLGFAEGQWLLRYVASPGPLVVGLLGGLEDLFPIANVRLRTENDVGTITNLIHSGQQDLAAAVTYTCAALEIPGPVGHSVVAREPAFLLLGQDHPLAEKPTVGLEELDGSAWILPAGGGTGVIEALTTACTRAGLTATIKHEGDASAARELVAAGKAIGLSQATFRSTPGIVPIPLTGNPLWLQHLLMWHHNGALADYIPEITERAEYAYAIAVNRSPHYLTWLSTSGYPQKTLLSTAPETFADTPALMPPGSRPEPM